MIGLFRLSFNAFRVPNPSILISRNLCYKNLTRYTSPLLASKLSQKQPQIPLNLSVVLHRKCSSNQSGGSSESGSSNKGKSGVSLSQWLFVILFLAAGGSAIAYNYGYFDSDSAPKAKEKKQKKKVPLESKEIPHEVPYLLIGGGTASFAAFRAIKSHEPKAKVMVITTELEMPYMRPPLSKEIWFDAHKKDDKKRLTFKQWNGVERSIFYEPDDFYRSPVELSESENGGVSIVRGYKVKKVDVNLKKAILEDGTEIKYEKCLIATGSNPRKLNVFKSDSLKSKVSVFKTVEDFENLMDVLDKTKSIAIIGGGFLGSEMACALAKYGSTKGMKVHQIFHEKGNMAKVIPQYLSGWTMDRVREEGVLVHPDSNVKSAELSGKQVKLELSSGESIVVDHVIVAAGSEPNIELAESSKLEVDEKIGGYVVNAELLARNNVYVAGDAANFYDPHLGRRRVEHHDHAVVSGRLAGENMVGLNKPYTHQSMFWSDLGPKVGYEAIGLIDSSLKTVAIFAKAPQKESEKSETEKSEEGEQKSVIKEDSELKAPQPEGDDYSKGIIFYLRGDRIVGILLWNVFNRINIARKIIAEDIRTTDFNEVAKLFNIHETQQE